MRAASYARYSSDHQKETSIDDQIKADREIALSLGAPIVAEYVDMAVSGTRRDRPNFLRMMADARTGLFEVLILWDLKRLSRGEDLPQLLAQLKFMGVRVVTCDGFDSDQQGSNLRGWFEGMMGHQYVVDLAKNVHRGLAGQFDRGLFAGGMAYGYTTIDTPDGRQIQINKDQAPWVLWIFEQYAAGISVQSIAHELNKRGVKSPRGSSWATSGIYGSPAKGTGIVNNELYVGRYIWNRSKFVKDPETGKRKRFERPRPEWKVADREELRIVPDDLWIAARARMGAPGSNGGGSGAGKRPTSLFGGILRCAECGGAVVIVAQNRYGCAAHKDRGPSVCSGVYVRRDTVEVRILSTLRDKLLSPDALAFIQQEVKKLNAARSSAADTSQANAKSRITTLDREIRNLTDAVAAAGWSQALHDRLAKAEQERDRVRMAGNAKPADVGQVQNILGSYREFLADLPGAMSRKPEHARAALRQMLGKAKVLKEGNAVYVEITAPAERILMAAGALDNSGSGGRITELSIVRIRLK